MTKDGIVKDVRGASEEAKGQSEIRPQTKKERKARPNRKGRKMKKYPKMGACERKHSINVIQKNMKEYFELMEVNADEIKEYISERMTSAVTEPQEACEWAGCDQV
jgi:hypothetical protein